MGFIGGGLKRKRKRMASDNNNDDIKRIKPLEKERYQSLHTNGELTFESLPAEILQHIFILSQNFSLAECSKKTWHALTYSKALNRKMLNKMRVPITIKGTSDISAYSISATTCARRFITVGLLKELNIIRFSDEDSFESVPVPPSVASKPLTSRKLDLLEYMLTANCILPGKTDLFQWAVEERDGALVKRYLSMGVPVDYRSLMLSIEMQNYYIAQDIVSSGRINLNDVNLWECVIKNQDRIAFEFLQKAGGNPPYHSIL